MINLEEAVVRKLKTVQHLLCTVESCTGGLLAHLITNVPGASEVYWGTFVTYDNSAKEDLGVHASIIETHGAVSEKTAIELAESGLSKFQRGLEGKHSYSLLKPRGLICVSTTGIAGPTGGTHDKPIGLCYFGLAISGRPTLSEAFQAPPNTSRVQSKMLFAQKALEFIRGNV